ITLPITDDWAQSSVYNYHKANIEQQIRQQYPNLPDTNRNQLIEEQFQQFLKANEAQITQQIQQTSEYFKQQIKDENGYTYLADIDSYVWLKHAKYNANEGYSGEVLKTGKELEEKGFKNLEPDKLYLYDSLVMAPLGGLLGPHMHPIVIAYTYKIFKVFSPKMTLAQASFYVPIMLALLSIIAAFFIGKRVGGNVAGFFAAMVIAVHPFFISRSFGSDTDPYNVFFPLIIIWFFIEAFEAKDAKKGIIYAGLAGLATGLFSFVWAFWYVFDFILAAMGAYFIYYIIVHWKGFDKIPEMLNHASIKKLFLVTIVYIILSGIVVTIFSGFGAFIGGFTGPLGLLTIKDSTHADLWPNVYTTVAELNSADWNSVVGSIGGRYLFIISIIGILLTFLKKDEHGKPDMKYVFLFTIWYLATIYASFKGVRFVLLLVPAFAIGIGAAAGIGYTYLRDWFSKSFSIDKKVTSVSLILLFFIIIFISPGNLVRAAHETSKNSLPLVDDAWWASLTTIKDNSSKDAIINSWWDFGHHFKYIAERAVTFDGASQNIPQAHWIGKVLLTNDEEQAISILKMLDCGANTAFEKVNEHYNDTDRSVDVVYDLLRLNKEDAFTYLQNKGFNNNQISDITKRLYCQPPEDYFITSEDMVGKSGVWAHFGSWNFDRANIWINGKGKNKEDMITFITENTAYKTREEAEKMYYEVSSIKTEDESNRWIAPWPSFASGPVGCNLAANTTKLLCGNGIGIDLSNFESTIPTQGGVKSLDAIGYFNGKDFTEIKTPTNNSVALSAGLMKNSEESYTLILAQEPLHTSLFMRLFYMNGGGVKHFNKLSEKRSMAGQNIIVWKVDWEGKKIESETPDNSAQTIPVS
ncbi:MAG: STT3 domain-containing protein, partial [Nanoarchaeota archaeon]|nr:STT3 domain-containing protein [Nanoarchaeota archaeon]